MAKNLNYVTYYDEEGNLKTLTDSGGGGTGEWIDVTSQGSFQGSNIYKLKIEESTKFQLRFCTPQTASPPDLNYKGLYITTPEIEISPQFIPQYEGQGYYPICTVRHPHLNTTSFTDVELQGTYSSATGAVDYYVVLTGIYGTFANFKCFKREIK